MTSSQLNVSETPPVSTEDLQTLAKNETDDNGLILGKFKTVEDLAASYKELEGKIGSVGVGSSLTPNLLTTAFAVSGFAVFDLDFLVGILRFLRL